MSVNSGARKAGKHACHKTPRLGGGGGSWGFLGGGGGSANFIFMRMGTFPKVCVAHEARIWID